ncbi:MAG: hypothetical protein V4537_10830 [Pseudomonadota bacterium]
MSNTAAIVAARASAVAARARLDASIAAAKQRVTPRALASDAIETARDKAIEAAQTGLTVARDRPGTTAAVAGALALALARKPLMRWLRWRDETGEDSAS